MWREACAFRRLMREAALPADARARLAEARLKAVLCQAYDRVPLHRRRMAAAGFDPRRDFRGPADLARLPLLTRAVLKETPVAELVRDGAARRLGRYYADSSSGSTGAPLTVYRARDERALQVAKWLRVLSHNGLRPWHRTLSLTASWRLRQGRSAVQRAGLYRRLALDYNRPMAELADLAVDYRPHLIYGNRSSLALLAEEFGRRGRGLPGLRLIVGGGETIEQADRVLFVRVFGVPLTETYGTVETGVLAYQRGTEPGLRLSDDLTWFEFLDDDDRPAAPGTPARIVVTELAARLMPILRYEVGDRVVFTETPGPLGPERRIQRIFGRADDIATLPSGAPLTWMQITLAMKRFAAIRRYRFRHAAPARFDVTIEAAADYFATHQAAIGDALAAMVAEPIRYDLRRVDRLEPDPGGKIRVLFRDFEDTAAPAGEA